MMSNYLPAKQLISAGAWLSLFLCLLPITGMASDTQTATPNSALLWSTLPPLPPMPGQESQPGLAGPFVGTHHNALILAGGANFPDALPWEGGTKIWHDQIYVWVEDKNGSGAWLVDPNNRLPRPLAYGMAVDTDNGILLMGGCDANACYQETYLLQWHPDTQKTTIIPQPAMPRTLAFGAAARTKSTVFVAGGQETTQQATASQSFFTFDLKEKLWHEPETWPGPARILPVGVTQSNGTSECFYLLSGRHIAPNKPTQILTDAYEYNPVSNAWTALNPIQPSGQDTAISLMAAPAIATGPSNILVFGGARGDLFLELEKLGQDIKTASSPAQKAKLKAHQTDLLNTHPGFSHEVLSYNTITQTWTQVDTMPGPAPVTTIAILWQNKIILPSGEISPGIRTPMVQQATPQNHPAFGVLNFSVLGIYLAILVGMGFYFARRETSTEDFFKAGGRIPWWAAGISIFGTQLSAITFIAIPAKTFATDWRYLMLNMAIVLVAPVIVFLFLPFYRRLNVTTAYEYLERRFSLTARLLASFMFVLLQFGRIGIVLFIPSIVLSVVTGIDVHVCILVMGGLSIVYTVLGGIEAVIWTDVIQVVVLIGGALLAIMIMLVRLEYGLFEAINSAWAAGKLHTFDFQFDISAPTFWTVMVGGLAAQLISYGSDQTVIQRYLTTANETEAARSIWTNALLCIPATVFFFFAGTALFLFYQAYPEAANPCLPSADAVFPWFIVTQLPAGLAGIVIAGVFAASMSSLDSSMNSVATSVTTDWALRFKPGLSDHTALNIARVTTIVIGVAGTGLALLMAAWGIQSLWDQFSQLLGLFAGGLGGMFLLGMLTRRANNTGTLIGLVASGMIQYWVKMHTHIHLLLYTLTGLASCFVIGYLASLLTNKHTSDLNGLTIYTQSKPKNIHNKE